MRLNSTFHSNAVLTLHASTNLSAWTNIGTLHNALFAYPDAASPGWRQRFYRVAAAARVATNDWKNQIVYPTDPFQSTNAAQSVTWVKFAILLDDPTRVYYQDSRKYLFHYDFATQRLPPFLGMGYAEFDAVSLYRTNQQVVLGTVLYPPATTYAEYGVQFIGLDAYTPEEIGRLVRAGQGHHLPVQQRRGVITCRRSSRARWPGPMPRRLRRWAFRSPRWTAGSRSTPATPPAGRWAG